MTEETRCAMLSAAIGTRPYRRLFGVAIFSYVAVRLWNVAAYDLSLDEIFSVQAVRYEWTEMFSLLALDAVHPPLFYVLLKMWAGVGGESLPWLRAFPLLFSFATIVPLLALCKELGLTKTATLFSLALVACNGHLSYYAQEVRMYSLLVFLTACSLALFAKYLKSTPPTRLLTLALAVVNVLVVYVHYYGWFVVATQCLSVLLLRRNRAIPFAVIAIACGLLFFPWALTVYSAHPQGSATDGLSWMLPPTATGFALYYANLTGKLGFILPGGDALSLLLCGAPIAWWIWRLSRRPAGEQGEEGQTFLFLVLFSLTPATAAFVMSYTGAQPVWHDRGLLIISLPFVILTAAATSQLSSKWTRGGLFALLLGAALLAAHHRLTVVAARNKMPWTVIAARLSGEETDAAGVRLYTLDPYWGYSLDYHLNARQDNRFDVVFVKGPLAGETAKSAFERSFASVTAVDFVAFGESHFWLMFDERDWQRRGAHPRELLEKAGFSVGAELLYQDGLTLIPVWRDDLVTQSAVIH